MQSNFKPIVPQPRWLCEKKSEHAVPFRGFACFFSQVLLLAARHITVASGHPTYSPSRKGGTHHDVATNDYCVDDFVTLCRSP
jgi:hypothetical protein